MPGMRCTVAVCNNSFIKTKNAGLNIAYHQFPKEEHMRNIWVSRCHRSGNWNPSSCHICSIHFTPDDYKENPFSCKRRLKPTAVPTLFLTEVPVIPGMKKCRQRKSKYVLKTEYNVTRADDLLTDDANVENYDSYNNYYPDEYEAESQLNYGNLVKDENGEEEQAEIAEIKYSQIMAAENSFMDYIEEPAVKEVTTQTEDDRILQICNILIQKNIQLENKVKQLEYKLTRLENYVQHSRAKEL